MGSKYFKLVEEVEKPASPVIKKRKIVHINITSIPNRYIKTEPMDIVYPNGTKRKRR